MKIIQGAYYLFKRNIFKILWFSVVAYLFYDSFNTYKIGEQYRRLRNILGVGLCLSRATAIVLNVSSALVLIPVCKKLNQLLFRVMSQVWPKIFFFWLERAKTCHMMLGFTLVAFSVVHSISHFINLWNFSKYYDEENPTLNFAKYRNQNPMELLLTFPALTGVTMLLITTIMTLSSFRFVRRRHYNLFRYTHQLFVTFLILLVLHPLSGSLKEEVIQDNGRHMYRNDTRNVTRLVTTTFTPIKSKTWMWMSLPLICCTTDFLWRCYSRNNTSVIVLKALLLPGRTISLKLSLPKISFQCRVGQYVLIQSSDISSLEWHPFSVSEVPKNGQQYFCLLVRVKGDWTASLENLIEQRSNTIGMPIELMLDGPYSSPLETVTSCEVSLCVAAGVGISPFCALLHYLLEKPTDRLPVRVHLIWIVRYECEITWIARLVTKVLLQLREANKPDKLHVEIYVTNKVNTSKGCGVDVVPKQQVITMKERKLLDEDKEEDTTKLFDIPFTKKYEQRKLESNKFARATQMQITNKDLLNKYPILGCRIKFGRPQWENIFEYWMHLYPRKRLPLFCCGPKQLTSTLRRHCRRTNSTSSTTIHLSHEGF